MNAAALQAALPPTDSLAADWIRASRRAVVAGIAAIGAAAAALATWSVAAPLGAAVVATGLVKVDTQRKTVQHRDGGTVRDILVREGDRVTAGQALVVLDDARIDASYDLARGQLDAVRMRQSRSPPRGMARPPGRPTMICGRGCRSRDWQTLARANPPCSPRVVRRSTRRLGWSPPDRRGEPWRRQRASVSTHRSPSRWAACRKRCSSTSRCSNSAS